MAYRFLPAGFAVDGEYACRGEQARGLHEVFILSDGQGEHVDVVKGESSDVDLSCLAIADGYFVVGNGCMGGSQASDGDSLQSADASVVFDVCSGKTADCVCYVLKTEVFQFFFIQELDGGGYGYSLWGAASFDSYFGDGVDFSGDGVFCLMGVCVGLRGTLGYVRLGLLGAQRGAEAADEAIYTEP